MRDDMTDRNALLGAFTRAWAAKDLDALMDLMAPDCEFRSSVGPEPGGVFLGRDEVRRGFALYLGPVEAPTAAVDSAPDLVEDQFAVTRWTARSQEADGSITEVRACDVFEFSGDHIRTKDTYRKVLGSLPSG